MSKMLTALTVLICINILLVLGGFSLSTDITRVFFNIDSNNEIQGYTGNLNASIPNSVLIAGQSEGGGEAEPSNFRITDVPKMLFDMFLFLLDVVFAPVAIFTSPTLAIPTQIKYMIATPFGIIFLFLVVGWWRGGSD